MALKESSRPAAQLLIIVGPSIGALDERYCAFWLAANLRTALNARAVAPVAIDS
jgi:hypothetical protein